jgi:hypothetical protein
MVMDWREMAGRYTVRGMQGSDLWKSYSWVWRGGKKVGFSWRDDHSSQFLGGIDPMRGWIIATCWIAACGAE